MSKTTSKAKATANKATESKAKATESKKTTAVAYKKNDVHKVVYDALKRYDIFVTESEQTARNTKCDKAVLACNRDDCTIIVREKNSCVRRFVEIWGLKNNNVRLFQNRKDFELLANKSKAIKNYFEKYKDEKLSAKYKKFVIVCDYKTAINCIQLMIDTSIKLDAKDAK